MVANSLSLFSGDPRGTRTPVAGVRGRSPRPLDDGAMRAANYMFGPVLSRLS